MSTSGEIIRTEHPILSIGQLCDEIRSPTGPVKRSTHAGNQPPRELALAVHFPPGLEILAVDTVTGADSYTVPCDIRLDNMSVPLCERKHAKSRLAGSLAVTTSELDPTAFGLVCIPELGESTLDFHDRAMAQLRPTNPPMLMSRHFAKLGEVYRAVMEAEFTQSGGHARLANGRNSVGLIVNPQLRETGILGCEDESPADCGVIPSLNGMMAVDIVDSHQRGSDHTLHLGAGDMVRYTRDPLRMGEVAAIVGKACAELGMRFRGHCYKVPDIRGLDTIFPKATHASQHQLLRTRGLVKVDMDELSNRSCAPIEGDK